MEPARAPRMLSLDAFRGLVIVAMLLVNNVGGTAGYFWKHADWREGFFAPSWSQWWGRLGGDVPWHYFFTQLPLWRHCTLADFVMPWFMLIIGLAIPFSVASATSRGVSAGSQFARAIRRGFMLVLLGWIMCYFRDQFGKWLYADPPIPFSVSLGMDVLQLLGWSYVFSRLLYCLPTSGRVVAIIGLFAWHWAFLRFWPQGPVPAGTFTEHDNAVAYVYRNWKWGFDVLGGLGEGWQGRLTLGFAGMLSAIPATAMMLLGTLAGDWMRRDGIDPRARGRALLKWGAVLMVIGIAWAFDLPMNKPRWTSCYLVYTAGVGLMVLAGLYRVIDVAGWKRWTLPLVVFGANAIAAYWVPIMAKVLLLNTPRVVVSGEKMSVTSAIVLWLKDSLGAIFNSGQRWDWGGDWAFTLLFLAFWWLVFAVAYRYRLIWKV